MKRLFEKYLVIRNTEEDNVHKNKQVKYYINQ